MPLSDKHTQEACERIRAAFNTQVGATVRLNKSDVRQLLQLAGESHFPVAMLHRPSNGDACVANVLDNYVLKPGMNAKLYLAAGVAP